MGRSDARTHALEHGTEEAAVEFLGAAEDRQPQPQQEDALGQPVDGDRLHYLVGGEVEQGVGAEHRPVRQPLGVVRLVHGFDGFD